MHQDEFPAGGEIRDEHEPDSDVQEDGEGGYIVSGSFDVARLSERLVGLGSVDATFVGSLLVQADFEGPPPSSLMQPRGALMDGIVV